MLEYTHTYIIGPTTVQNVYATAHTLHLGPYCILGDSIQLFTVYATVHTVHLVGYCIYGRQYTQFLARIQYKKLSACIKITIRRFTLHVAYSTYENNV